MSKSVKRLRSKRDAKVAELETLVKSVADAEEAREFTPEEAETRGRLTAEIEGVEDRIRAARKAKRQAKKEARAQEARLGYGFVPVKNASGVKVKSEHRTYERGNGLSYFQDLCVYGMGPGPMGSKWSQAAERLQAHSTENRVEAIDAEGKGAVRSAEEDYFVRQYTEALNKREDRQGHVSVRAALSTSSGAGGEFVPPLYLTADWIAYLRAGRVLADCQHQEALPDGTMSINLPKVNSGTAVANQSAENTAVQETDLGTEYVTFPVKTYAGQQTVSLQLLERSPIAFDRVVIQDLGKAYAQQVDQAVLAEIVARASTVTWTQATPSVVGLYGQIGLAKSAIATSLFLPATHCFMHPEMWEWISQTVDANKRPLVTPEYNAPFANLAVNADDATAEGLVGRQFQGLRTFEDANIPTNLGSSTDYTEVLVLRPEENWLMESPIVTRVLPQTLGNQLSVILQMYGYVAVTADRYPTANQVITGSGLVFPPAFNS